MRPWRPEGGSSDAMKGVLQLSPSFLLCFFSACSNTPRAAWCRLQPTQAKEVAHSESPATLSRCACARRIRCPHLRPHARACYVADSTGFLSGASALQPWAQSWGTAVTRPGRHQGKERESSASDDDGIIEASTLRRSLLMQSDRAAATGSRRPSASCSAWPSLVASRSHSSPAAHACSTAARGGSNHLQHGARDCYMYCIQQSMLYLPPFSW